MIAITVRHNFETAHRLPALEGKCTSLHGHSWQVAVTVGSEWSSMAVDLLPDGILIDFGTLKRELRSWTDTYLDHGVMLGVDDPLVPILKEHGKVFVFEHGMGSWPTVENVAGLLADVTADLLDRLDNGIPIKVLRCEVQETSVNAATWTP